MFFQYCPVSSCLSLTEEHTTDFSSHLGLPISRLQSSFLSHLLSTCAVAGDYSVKEDDLQCQQLLFVFLI